MVRGLTATGVTVLLTTQYLEEADVLARQIAVVGRTEAQSSMALGRGRQLVGLIGRYGGIRREDERAYGPQRLPGDGKRLPAGGQDTASQPGRGAARRSACWRHHLAEPDLQRPQHRDLYVHDCAGSG